MTPHCVFCSRPAFPCSYLDRQLSLGPMPWLEAWELLGFSVVVQLPAPSRMVNLVLQEEQNSWGPTGLRPPSAEPAEQAGLYREPCSSPRLPSLVGVPS